MLFVENSVAMTTNSCASLSSTKLSRSAMGQKTDRSQSLYLQLSFCYVDGFCLLNKYLFRE